MADPAALARAAGVNPERLKFEWKDYLALDDASVLRRFEKRFGKPASTNLSLTNGALAISGPVPYEWLRRVREDGMQSPGVTSIAENDVRVTYDPELAVGRFLRAFPPPPGVTAKFANGTLELAGTAPYEWLAPVRAGRHKTSRHRKNLRREPACDLRQQVCAPAFCRSLQFARQRECEAGEKNPRPFRRSAARLADARAARRPDRSPASKRSTNII